MNTLLFHIGRGGRFNNAGHLYYEGIGGINQAPVILNDEYFYPIKGEDEGGNPIDDMSDDAELLDECGNGIGLTVGELNRNEGRIDIDGEYNTWYTEHSDNLSDREADAVLKHYKDDDPRLFPEDLEILLDIADHSDIADEIADYLHEARYYSSSAVDLTAAANVWLSKNGYDIIEY